MPDSADPRTFRFDNFVLDKPTGILLRIRPDGAPGQVQLGTRAFRILCLLVERQGAVVTRQEIMDAAWPNLIVEDNNLSVQLSNLRRVLDAERDGASCVQTLPGRGYRFLPSVTVSDRRSFETAQSDAGAYGIALSGAAMIAAIQGEESNPATMSIVPPRSNEVAGGSPGRGGASAAPPRRWPRLRGRSVVAGIFGAILIGSLSWVGASIPWVNTSPGTTPSPVSPRVAGDTGAMDASRTVPPTEAPGIRRRLSVAVLPFTGSGGADDSVVEALGETLTVELAQQNMVVIGSAAIRPHRDKAADIRRIGDDLGVRYAVQGDVRKEDDGRHVIQAHLLSTETGEYLWAERFNLAPGGRDETLDSIARRVAFTVVFRVVDDESQHVTREHGEHLDVEDVLILARAVYNMPRSPRKYERLIGLFERALELDPSSLRGLSGLAEALINTIDGWSDDPTADGKLRRAELLIDQAEALQPNDRMVMLARLQLLGMRDRCPELFPVARRIKERHPSLSSPDFFQGWCELRAGNPVAAITSFEASINVHPRNPEVDNRHRMIGYALLSLGRYEEAVAAQRMALAANPTAGPRRRAASHAGIAAALALAGDTAAARQSAAEATRLWPMLTIRGFLPLGEPASAITATYERLWNGLRLAGVRDHAEEDFDPGLPADDVLRTEYEAPTPFGTPGVRTIRTQDLVDLVRQRPVLVLDTDRDGASIPGAIGLEGAGIGGSVTDAYQDRLRQVLRTLSEVSRAAPMVTVGWNAERFQGRNLALRLAAMGYTEVYWYRGGREAWMAAGHEVAPVSSRDW
jgi:DNA-binding winged helix-turn-helix (wHTH) protein/TolB-like protein